MKAKKNIGSIDRIVRVVLALVFGVLYFTGIVPGTLGLVLVILAVVFLATSFVTVCPIYMAFGLSTATKEE